MNLYLTEAEMRPAWKRKTYFWYDTQGFTTFQWVISTWASGILVYFILGGLGKLSWIIF
jgi:hypothetical protein